MAALLATGAILTCFRWHAFAAPLESDECNYAYFAGRLLEGARLYVDVWDHQPPGIFAFLTIPTAICGSSPAVYRTLALIACLLTLLMLFDVARRCFGQAAAWMTALSYALVSSDPGTGGEGCNREIYMNVLVTAALWTACRRLSPGRSDTGSGVESRTGVGPPIRSIFLAGVLIGLASTIKTVVAVQWLALLVLPFAVCRSSPASHAGNTSAPTGRPARLLRAACAFALGPALVWIAVWAYFAATSRSAEFIDAAFTYNLGYGKFDQPIFTKMAAFFSKETVFRPAIALWIAGGVGLFALPWRRAFLISLLMAAFALGSFLAVCLPGQFWPHYYHLMLPPLTLLAGGLVQRATARSVGLSVFTSAAVIVWLAVTQAEGYLRVKPDHIAWDRYKDRMAWVRDQAGRVASVTSPQDSIYVWSADAGLYYYSGRRCASRYTMFGALVADHASTAARRRILINDLSRSKPRLILIPAVAQRPCPELLAFIQERKYVPVGKDNRGMEVLCDLERLIPSTDWTWRSTD